MRLDEALNELKNKGFTVISDGAIDWDVEILMEHLSDEEETADACGIQYIYCGADATIMRLDDNGYMQDALYYARRPKLDDGCYLHSLD